MHKNDPKPLLLCQIEPPQNTEGGDYYYRTHAPGKAMARNEGIYIINLTNEHRYKFEILEQADVLVLKNICDPDFLPLIAKRKSKGKLTIYEIADDLSAVEAWNPVYFFYKNEENLDLVYLLANFCDALQVTCPELDRLYGRLNRNSRVFPNQISHVPPERPFLNRPSTTIGWAGSHGHLEDMKEIALPLINWIKTRPGVRLHLMCSGPIWHLFDALPQKNKKRTQPGSLEDYFQFLSEIDIGLAPLKDTPFNRSRSDVKFLEYAVSGVVPVVQNLRPYSESLVHGETGLFFNGPDELISALEHLAQDSGLLRRLSKAARCYILEKRMEDSHAQDRLTFYKELRKDALPAPGGSVPQTADRFADWSRMRAAISQGRHLRLEQTRFEVLLQDGLIAMQVMKEKALAHRLFDEAALLQPDNYLPHLFGSPVSSDPVKVLRKAVELRPESIRAWVMLGEELSIKRRFKEALNCFASAANIFPDYDIPYRRAASLLEKLGEKDQALKLIEKAGHLTIPVADWETSCVPRQAAMGG